MIPPAAAPPSAPIPAPFSRVVNGVEQAAKAARKNISAKNLDFLIIVPLLFFVLSRPVSSPTRTGRRDGLCAGWKKVALRALLATRKLRYARLLVSVTERKHGANHLSDSDLREINSNTGSSQRRDTRGPEETCRAFDAAR